MEIEEIKANDINKVLKKFGFYIREKVYKEIGRVMEKWGKFTIDELMDWISTEEKYQKILFLHIKINIELLFY